jgi:ankyrin repeat protein
MPTRALPNNPSLEHLRKDAKRLRGRVLAAGADAIDQVKAFHPRASAALARFSLADAQLVTARSYGFASWTKLKQHLASIEPFVWNPPPVDEGSRVDVFVRLACLTYTAWHPSPARAARMLAEEPGLGRASIYTAAAVGDVAAIGTMLDREPALVNRKGGPLHWAPLLYACYSRVEAADRRHATLEAVRLLLSRGADPNAGFLYAGNYAFTALTGAFGRGEDWPHQPPHPECARVARLLLDAGADPNDAQTLYNRHFRPDDEHLELLFEYGLGQSKGGPWIARLNDPLFTPASLLVIELCAAAQHGFFGRVELLVGHGVDVNGRSRRTGRTPYEEAIRAGHQAIAEYLARHGANRVDLDDTEAFALACISGRAGEVQARLARDPSILERLGRHGRIDMLHRAAAANQPAGVRLIAALGVDVNAMAPGGGLDRSALHNAAGWGSLDMVKLLVELGADPHLRDLTYHATPIAWARYNGQRPEVIAFLLPLATIFDAVRCDGVERVAALLREDPSLAKARDDHGDPLVFCLHPGLRRMDEMIGLLAAHGADLNAPDPSGRTLLDRAVSQGLVEFADSLRRHGATASGSTPAEAP